MPRRSKCYFDDSINRKVHVFKLGEWVCQCGDERVQRPEGFRRQFYLGKHDRAEERPKTYEERIAEGW